MSLILTALYTKGSIKTVAIATLPSISTILGGLLFGGMTLYSKTMIPAIWLGNFAFILLYKVLYVNKSWKYLVVASMAVLTKTMIIYLGFMIMVNTMIVPDMVKQTLSTSMGITQLITATSGSLLVTLIMILTRVKRDKVKQ